jgi:O-antigen/teichoic acid export membrane protein
MEGLKGRTIRGGFARICAQFVTLFLRVGSLAILARLLKPTDFGVVGMVTAFTGVLTWFRDFGLSSAAIQQHTISEEQLSTLFWINVLFGVLLSLVTVAMARAIASLYGQPLLFNVTIVLATGFLFNAAGVQHSARLQREMRFTTLAVVNVLSLMIGFVIAIVGAILGYGYWALVAMSVVSPFAATLGFWLTTSWVPGRPHRHIGIPSMMHFGGTLTLSGLLSYMAFNADKVMIGWFWGADVLGSYGRGYQLITIPMDNINSPIGEVAFSALSRLQGDDVKLRAYFLKGFSLILNLTLPSMMICSLFADDLVVVFLGRGWEDTVKIVRLLAPTIAIFAITNPLGWLLFSMRRANQTLVISLVLLPSMVAGFAVGLPYGPGGVAFAYSAVMIFWAIPVIFWCVRGTVISFRDIILAASRPLVSGILAGGVAFGGRVICFQAISPFPRLVFESSILLAVFFGFLLLFREERLLYVNILRELTGA